MRPRYGDASGSEGHGVAALVAGELEAVLIGRREAVAGLLAALGAVQHRFDFISLVSAGGRAEGEPHDPVVAVRVVVPLLELAGREPDDLAGPDGHRLGRRGVRPVGDVEGGLAGLSVEHLLLVVVGAKSPKNNSPCSSSKYFIAE